MRSSATYIYFSLQPARELSECQWHRIFITKSFQLWFKFWLCRYIEWCQMMDLMHWTVQTVLHILLVIGSKNFRQNTNWTVFFKIGLVCFFNCPKHFVLLYVQVTPVEGWLSRRWRRVELLTIMWVFLSKFCHVFHILLNDNGPRKGKKGRGRVLYLIGCHLALNGDDSC